MYMYVIMPTVAHYKKKSRGLMNYATDFANFDSIYTQK